MRDVSEREFINYVRGVGGYPAYSAAAQDVEKVFTALKSTLTDSQFAATTALLPPGVRSIWERIPILDQLFLFQTPCKEQRAFSAVFSALKEKLQDHAAAWADILDDSLQEYWFRSDTIDSSQKPGQFL